MLLVRNRLRELGHSQEVTKGRFMQRILQNLGAGCVKDSFKRTAKNALVFWNQICSVRDIQQLSNQEYTQNKSAESLKRAGEYLSFGDFKRLAQHCTKELWNLGRRELTHKEIFRVQNLMLLLWMVTEPCRRSCEMLGIEAKDVQFKGTLIVFISIDLIY